MKLAPIITEMKIQKDNFLFRVRAYRKLTPGELKTAYILWYRQRDKRKSLKNKTIEVISIIGHDE